MFADCANDILTYLDAMIGRISKRSTGIFRNGFQDTAARARLTLSPEMRRASEASRSDAELQCATIYWMRRAVLPLLRLVEDDTAALRQIRNWGSVKMRPCRSNRSF